MNPAGKRGWGVLQGGQGGGSAKGAGRERGEEGSGVHTSVDLAENKLKATPWMNGQTKCGQTPTTEYYSAPTMRQTSRTFC